MDGWTDALRHKVLDRRVSMLTSSTMIMTFILCYERDQMLQVFGCQATVEHRARRPELFYYVTANGGQSNLSTSLGENLSVIMLLNSVSHELG